MLTIRDHILRGGYPVTEDGFALVPMRSRSMLTFPRERDLAIIVTPHGPEPKPLIGWFYFSDGSSQVANWAAGGQFDLGRPGQSSLDLMPPIVRLLTAADLGIEEAA